MKQIAAISKAQSEIERLRAVETPLGMSLIESITLDSASGSVVFPSTGSIPATFRSLELHFHARTDRSTFTTDAISIKFNGDTGNNYYSYDIRFSASPAVSGVSEIVAGSGMRSIITPTACGPANVYGTGRTFIPSYRSPLHKSCESTYGSRGANAAGSLLYGVAYGSWESTASIGTISIHTVSGCNISASSVISLYGIG